MKNNHMFGISQRNGVKKHFFRPEKGHGFARPFYSALHTTYVAANSDAVDQQFLCKAVLAFHAQRPPRTDRAAVLTSFVVSAQSVAHALTYM